MLIAKLLQIADPIDADSLRQVLLDNDEREAADARTVLAGALQSSRRAGVTDPQQFYRGLCEAAPEQLARGMTDTVAESLPPLRMMRAQAVLKDHLTSKAGRPVGGEARRIQVAEAQARRREKLAKQENRKQINEWISMDAAERLAKFQQLYGCRSRVEALELVLQEDVLAFLQARLPAT